MSLAMIEYVFAHNLAQDPGGETLQDIFDALKLRAKDLRDKAAAACPEFVELHPLEDEIGWSVARRILERRTA